MNRFCVAFLFLFMLFPAFGQENDTIFAIQGSDSIFQIGEENLPRPDTIIVEAREPKTPTRALLYALALPGLGQAYNGKYWKIPIVWAALGGVGYAISFNTKQYEQATLNFIMDESSDNERILKGWKRNMELSYIVGVLVYGLQILDAYVDANLYSWDVNDNLSMGISPSILPMMTPESFKGITGGLTCSIKIRGR